MRSHFRSITGRLQGQGAARRRAFLPHPLAAALAASSLLTLGLDLQLARAQTLPSGLSVVQGQARLTTTGSTLTVTNSPGAVLNWNAFSIGAQSAVRFDQASASSAVLNRVTGNDPSQVLGRLSSNGKVWLLNPNGVLFGPGARVDVAGLVVSTLNLADSDWSAGRNAFTLTRGGGSGGAGSAEIVNLGELRTPLRGRVMLVGASLRNEGLIEAPGGQIVLAAGHSVELRDTGAPNLSVKVSAPQGSALNLGQLLAAGGRIDLQAALVNQNGLVRAESLKLGVGGEIVMRATQALNLGADSRTVVDGGSGGTLTIDAGKGTTTVLGQLSATGSTGAGGQVQLLGQQVALAGAAAVDVSGASGGGQVLVGGGQQGRDTSVPNADAVFFGPNARIAADATASGSGGRIILWSDSSTRAYGSLSVRGGPQGGNGGFIETSGGWLDARPAKVDTRASRGAAGQWLIDPHDVVVSDVFVADGRHGTLNIEPASYFTANGDSAQILSSDITRALQAGTAVTISTGPGPGTQAGNVSFRDAHIQPTPAAGVGQLNVLASGSISVTRSLINSAAGGGQMNINLQAGGAVSILGSTLQTNGGRLDIAGTTRLDPAAVSLQQGSVLDAGSGSLSVRGVHLGTANVATGVLIDAATLKASSISVDGSAVSSSSASTGVDLVGSTLAGILLARVTGTGASTGVRLTGGNHLHVDPTSVDPSASLVINGTETSLASGDGVLIMDGSGGAPLMTTRGASILITGYAAGPIGGNTVGIRAIDDRLRSLRVRSSGAQELRSNHSIQLHDFGLISSSTLTLAAPSITVLSPSTLPPQRSAGDFLLEADTLTLGAGAQLQSKASGDTAMLLKGFSGNEIRTVRNDAGSAVLSVPSGRWLLYATNPLDPALHGLGDLNYGFRQYGATVGDAVLGSGNGLMFATPQVAAVRADVASRAYDGSTSASLSNIHIQLLAGDVAVGTDLGAATFASADVGVDKPVAIAGFGAVSLRDANSRPVYGYGMSSNLTGTVLRKPLQLTVRALDKVYDTTKATTGALLHSPVGLVGSEQVTVILHAAFEDKNVGVSKPVVLQAQLGDGAGGGKASNYSVAPFESRQLANITAAPLVVGGLVAVNKVYDSFSSAALSGVIQYTPLAGDQVSVSSGTARFADKSVGSAKPVALAGFALSGGADAGNYKLVLPTNLRADITPARLSVNGLTVNDKTYDATPSTTFSNAGSVAALAADMVTLSTGTARFSDKNVGSGKTVQATGFALAGADASNYVLDPVSALSANITAAPLVLGGLVAVNKVYDSASSAALSGTPQYTPLAGDQVSVSSGTARFADKSVGSAKPVALAGFALSGGADAGNYKLVLPENLRADITPARLSVNGLTVNDKTYDATSAVTFSSAGSVTALAADTVTLSTGTARFADKNVGSGKTVQATGFALAGADASNYVLDPVSALSANITAAPLVVGGLVAVSKVYDSAPSAALSGTPQYTPLAGDQVSVSSGTARFADKSVGSAKPVVLTGFALSGGADAGNYKLVLPTNLSADITPARLSVNGLTVNDKTYDATSAVTFSSAGSVVALAADTVTMTPGTARFADKNVGTGKTVQATGFALGGADASNYVLDPVSALSANITAAPLVVGGLVAVSKVYDSFAAATFGGSAAVQALAGDRVSVAGNGVASFADKNVGSAKSVSVSGLTLVGADATNYQMVAPMLVANITAAPLVYLAKAASKSVGEAVPPLAGTVSGFVGADTAQSSTTGVMAFSSTADAQSPTGSYAIDGSGLAAANYRFQQAAGNASALTVSPAVIPVNLSQVTASPISNVGVVPTASRSSATGGLIDAMQAPAAGNAVNSVAAAAPAAAAPAAAATPDAAAAPSTPAAAGTASPAGPKPSFAGVRLSEMSKDEVAGMLAERDQYKKVLFADAIVRLEENASLADLPSCQSGADIAQGKCLLTDELKQQLQLARAVAQPQVEPSTQAQPLAAPSELVAVETSDLPLINFALAQKRKVKSAALPQIERKVAVLIGVDAYQDERIPKLSNAVNDARSVASLFESALGYETVVIANATKSAVVSAMNKLALELGPKDSVIVYYAGHGELVEATGLGYWQLADSDATQPKTWLSNADISRMVAQIGASQVALISDSCYSGSLVSNDQIHSSAAGADPKPLLAHKSVVVMSSGGNEPVADDARDGHSPFAWNLMNQLKQVNGWQPGGNVFARVRYAVARELPQRPKYGSSSAAGHQEGGDYLFERRQLEVTP